MLGKESAAQNACYQTPPTTTACLAHFTFAVGQTYLPYGSQCLCGDGVPRGYADCWIKTDQCSATCSTCQVSGGSPINLSTGNTFVSQTDISLPGLGGGISLARTWNSIVPSGVQSPGMFGMSWTSTYEERVSIDSDGLVKASSGNGYLWSFGVTDMFAAGGTQSTYSEIAPRNGGASLVSDGTHLTLTFKSGESKVFSLATGRLLSMSDRNGNTVQLSYDASNRLVGVTDAASRHLYFNYPEGSNLVTSVTSDFGVSLSYSYDGLYLSQVTRPDGTFLTFEYTVPPGSPTYLLTAVKDQNGKILESHTYDTVGRGLSSQRSNGVDALSVTYLQ